MSSIQEGSAEERAWAATTEEAAEVRRQRVSELESLEQPKSFLDADAQHRPAGMYHGGAGGGSFFDSIKERTSSLLSVVKDTAPGTVHEASAEERSLDATVAQDHRDRTLTERLGGAGDGYTARDAARDTKNEEERMITDAARRTKEYVGEKKERAMFTLNNLANDAKENLQDRRSDDEMYTLKDAAGDAKNFAAEAKDDEERMISDAAKKTKEYAGDAKDQAKNTLRYEKNMVRDEAQMAKDYVGDKKDQAMGKVNLAKENASEAKENEERMIGDSAQRTREFAGEAKDQAASALREEKNMLSDTAQRIKDYVGEKKDQVMDALKGAKDSAGEAKDDEERAIGDAAQRTRDTLKDAKDSSVEVKDNEERMIGDTAQRTKDYIGNKKDRAMHTLKDSSDFAADTKNDEGRRIGDAAEKTKDYVGEKKDEGKHMLSDLERNVKDYMADHRGAEEGKRTLIDSARDAMDYLTEKKEELRKSLAGDAKTRMGETPESATIKLQIVKEKEKERGIQNWEEHEQSRDVAGRGSDASSNIYGAWPVNVGSVTEAFKQKMTMPEEVVEQKRADQDGLSTSQTQ